MMILCVSFILTLIVVTSTIEFAFGELFHIRHTKSEYWEYWYDRMCGKYGRDWVLIHWAWEVDDVVGG